MILTPYYVGSPVCNNEVEVTAQYRNDRGNTMRNITCMLQSEFNIIKCNFNKEPGFDASNSAAINLTLSGSNITKTIPLEFRVINDSIGITLNGSEQYFNRTERVLELNQTLECISSLQASIVLGEHEGSFLIETLDISELLNYNIVLLCILSLLITGRIDGHGTTSTTDISSTSTKTASSTTASTSTTSPNASSTTTTSPTASNITGAIIGATVAISFLLLFIIVVVLVLIATILRRKKSHFFDHGPFTTSNREDNNYETINTLPHPMTPAFETGSRYNDGSTRNLSMASFDMSSRNNHLYPQNDLPLPPVESDFATIEEWRRYEAENDPIPNPFYATTSAFSSSTGSALIEAPNYETIQEAKQRFAPQVGGSLHHINDVHQIQDPHHTARSLQDIHTTMHPTELPWTGSVNSRNRNMAAKKIHPPHFHYNEMDFGPPHSNVSPLTKSLMASHLITDQKSAMEANGEMEDQSPGAIENDFYVTTSELEPEYFTFIDDSHVVSRVEEPSSSSAKPESTAPQRAGEESTDSISALDDSDPIYSEVKKTRSKENLVSTEEHDITEEGSHIEDLPPPVPPPFKYEEGELLEVNEMSDNEMRERVELGQEKKERNNEIQPQTEHDHKENLNNTDTSLPERHVDAQEPSLLPLAMNVDDMPPHDEKKTENREQPKLLGNVIEEFGKEN